MLACHAGSPEELGAINERRRPPVAGKGPERSGVCVSICALNNCFVDARGVSKINGQRQRLSE